MEIRFFKASALAGSMFFLIACGNNQEATESKAVELAEQEVVAVEASEDINTSKEAQNFPDPAPALQQQVNQLLNHYLEIKNALVASSAESTSEAANKLLAGIENFAGNNLPQEQQDYYKEQVAAMQNHLQNMVEAKEINKQREQFVVVTENIFQLTKAFNPTEEPVYYQYCPMAFNNNGGYWLSAQKEIRNPYFGDKMLKCGRVEATL